MKFLFVAESLIYNICLIIISVRIYDCKLKKPTILLNLLLHFILMILALKLKYDIFLFYFTLSLILEIIFLKLSINNISIRSLLYLFLLLFSFNIILNSSIISFISTSTKTDVLIELIIHLLMLLICVSVCYSKLIDKTKIVLLWTPKSIKFLIVSLLLLSVIINALIIDLGSQSKNDRFLMAIHRFLVLLILCIFISLCILIFNAISNTYLKKLTQSYEEQIKIQAEHYAALSKANFELRRFRHDFKNISLGVKELIAEGKQTEALNILESAKENVYSTTDSMLHFDTGNGIVDALLSDKQRNAFPSNIIIQFEGSVPPEGISATELCVIFGNTVDNAVEACEKIGTETEKIIDIKCKCVSGFMFLNITNPVNEPVIIKNNTVQTTKSDKSLHGFGLYSLEKTVNRHDGKIELLCNDNEFSVNISMLINN